jgi:hypothetical protein
VPANARIGDLINVNNVVYATTTNKCGGTADAIYAVDLGSETKNVVSWKPNGGSPLGGIAFNPDGTEVYAAVGPGQAPSGGYANAIVGLDPKTLQPKDWLTGITNDLATGPVVVSDHGKVLVAAATSDGRVYLLDAGSLGGSNHTTPLYVSRAYSTTRSGVGPTSLASWEEQIADLNPPSAAAAGAPANGAGAAPQPATTPGTRWILMPISTPPADAGLPSTNGAVSSGAVLALKVVNAGGKPALEPGWVSHDLPAVSSPLIVNGVVFALARGGRTISAVLYGFDGISGKELWNSGKTMTSFVPNNALWAGNSQVYAATFDGMVYAFGFTQERR